MTSRELVQRVIARKNQGENPFWLGNPTDEAKEIYLKAIGFVDNEARENVESDPTYFTKFSYKAEICLAQETQSDIIWFSPELDEEAYQDPAGKPMWDNRVVTEIKTLSQPGIFQDTEDVAEIENFPWPKAEYISLEATFEHVKAAYDQGLAVLGGMWCPFFHVLSDFFGMENYFIKMHTDPEVVLAATEHVVDFYLAANKRCLDKMAPYLTAGFFGNDFGSQLNSLISPACFEKFIFPYLKKIADQIKSYNLPVVMHSCGAVFQLIPYLIEAGVEVLHPIQAAAAHMEPSMLQETYGDKLLFMGGVDTQDLLPFGTVKEVEEKVMELRKIFGPNFIVSPSHEALLPNVSFDKVMAMSRRAKS